MADNIALENALAYAAKGLYVFPLQAGGKKPLKDWSWPTQCSCDPTEITAWAEEYPGCNWGVACGPSGLLVLDCDTKLPDGRRTTAGEDWLLKQWSHHGEGPCWAVRTPSGGLHLYTTGKARNKVRLKDLPEDVLIDVRADGGYVVIPGSSTPDGGGEWTVCCDADPVPTPDWVMELIGPSSDSERLADAAIPLVELDLPQNIDEAERVALTFPGVGQGSRDDTAYKNALALRDYSVSASECYRMLATHWDPQNMPPLGEDLLNVVQHAYDYANDRPGNRVEHCVDPAEALALLPELPPPDSLLDPSEWETGDEACDSEDIPDTWIIPNVLQWDPGMVVLLTGTPGVGKSLLINQLLWCNAVRQQWIGADFEHYVDQVLYVSAEDSRKEVRKRLKAYKRNHGNIGTGDRYHVWHRQGKDNTLAQELTPGVVVSGVFREQLREKLLSMHSGPKICILDTGRKFFAGNENVAACIYQLIGQHYEALGLETNTMFIIPHHPNKAGDPYAGSSAYPAAVRAHLHLAWYGEDPETTVRELTVLKANGGPVGHSLLCQWRDGCFHAVAAGSIEDNQDRAVYDHILREASQNDRRLGMHASSSHPLKSEKITAEGHRMSAADVVRAAKRLIEDGLIENVTGTKHRNGLEVINPWEPTTTGEQEHER